ncbi:carboxyl-terminal-processing peptidase 1, chloroplastic [Dorcoceras hygrometricum]|uniref:Carboxyl-terminal-processing peptidase 1, chloroplastic n=1 Tax=Dorcoceras hygrometricum TaxID=472368 RepID=A0A2Z7CAE3_9LAMI|nr:carboxyl-terminal-processing peptidase 1, chloroplastic [Dorcoceras hygrometricum]
MVKRLATSPHDPLGITDSACKNQLVVVSVQYDPFNTYIPIRSTTIGKSRVARDPIAMHTSWRSNSDMASVTRCFLSEKPAGAFLARNQQVLLSEKPAGNQQVLLSEKPAGACLRPDSQGIWHFKVGGGRSPQCGPRLDARILRITDSACKNQLVVVSVQYGPFNTYIPIRSTTIGKSRVARDPIAMHTSWRSNSDIASIASIGYPRMRASGESSTTKHRLLHASGPHPIPPPNDPIVAISRRTISCSAVVYFIVQQLIVRSSIDNCSSADSMFIS